MITVSRIKADLDWIINSPAIMSPCFHPAFINDYYSENHQLGKTIESLGADIRNSGLCELQTSRLGLYYEKLCHYLLLLSDKRELLFANLQIHENGQTLGEFDQIYRDMQFQRNFHRELSVKFYLGVADDKAGMTHPAWVGPNLRDRLDVKLARLVNHQLELTNLEAARAWLSRQAIHGDIQVEAQLQGYLFYPFGYKITAPESVNPNHLRGTWIRYSEIEQWSRLLPPSSVVMLLKKQQWLSGYDFSSVAAKSEFNKEFTSQEHANYCREIVSRSNRPLMFEVCYRGSSNYMEKQRIIIVHDDWPDAALAFMNSELLT